ncbi:hypothetical protein K458DRAFT_416026, partial [Lentithecium fluviatile CBS 122367]
MSYLALRIRIHSGAGTCAVKRSEAKRRSQKDSAQPNSARIRHHSIRSFKTPHTAYHRPPTTAQRPPRRISQKRDRPQAKPSPAQRSHHLLPYRTVRATPRLHHVYYACTYVGRKRELEQARSKRRTSSIHFV